MYHKTVIETEIKRENDYMLLQKQGEIKIMGTANANQTKMQLEEFRKKFESDLTAFKKEQDRQIRLEGIDASAQNQQQLIKLRKGEIDDINEEPTQSITFTPSALTGTCTITASSAIFTTALVGGSIVLADGIVSLTTYTTTRPTHTHTHTHTHTQVAPTCILIRIYLS